MPVRCLILLLVVAAVLPPPPLMAQPTALYFMASGQRLDDRNGFLSEWRTHDGALTLGLPLSPAQTVGDRVIQYFERGRLERGPDGAVERAPVGREYLARIRRAVSSDARTPSPDAAFRAYYRLHGAESIFGRALTAAYWEFVGDALVQVQYFERARLEAGAAGDITIAALGAELLRGEGLTFARAERGTAQAVNPDGSVWRPGVPADVSVQKRIIVDLSDQWLYALDGGRLVFDAPVTTGRPGWETPIGEHRVYAKLHLQTMSACSGGECWNVPDVPHVMYIYGGVALHGTYWHNAFGSGRLLSHGCVNLSQRSAAWLYDWTPYGTPVTVRE